MFGTDGIRGVANTELDCELALAVGKAAAEVLLETGGHKAKVLIGKDSRLSSDMLESVMAAGFASAGADVILLGVLPTPAVAYLVKELKADAGVMISASHNPAEYNGIKMFGQSGYKLSDSLEDEIESLIESNNIPIVESKKIGRISTDHEAIYKYIKHIQTAGSPLNGLKIALDCSHGSASFTAEKMFCDLGAKCVIINDKPNGLNINLNCGSLHIDGLKQTVIAENCDVGFAFDGDADRCIAVSGSGQVLDGDQMIAVFAKAFKEENKLSGNSLVATKMSNLGLLKFAEAHGIQAALTDVGDRYVLEEMLKSGYILGGENSGHIIFSEYLPSGDGQLTGVLFASIMVKSKKSADELASVIQLCPQAMKNIRVKPAQKKLVEQDEEILAAICRAEALMGSDGRVIVRASGTEPLIRVMVECLDVELANKIAGEIAGIIKERLD